MGKVPPHPPVLPPYQSASASRYDYFNAPRRGNLPSSALDITIESHRLAWARYEAEREVDMGASYTKTPVDELRFVQYSTHGRVIRKDQPCPPSRPAVSPSIKC